MTDAIALPSVIKTIDEAKKAGITNQYAIAGMLAIISKESSFIPKQERAYSGTSNSRIRKVYT